MNEINYNGRDNLDAMTEARNYNNFLLRLITKNTPPLNLHNSCLTIDFGAGSGTFAKPISKINKNIICVETDHILKEKLKSLGLQVIDDINILNNDSINYLYSLNVLEHIKDDEDTLKSWHAKLAKNGKILIYVPAFNILYSSMDKKVGHFRRYTKSDLRQKIENAGFRVDKICYADSIGFFASLAFKWFGNDSGDINIKTLKIYDRLIFPFSLILDLFVSLFFGKNIFAVASKV